jgi:hypothetical protein
MTVWRSRKRSRPILCITRQIWTSAKCRNSSHVNCMSVSRGNGHGPKWWDLLNNPFTYREPYCRSAQRLLVSKATFKIAVVPRKGAYPVLPSYLLVPADATTTTPLFQRIAQRPRDDSDLHWKEKYNDEQIPWFNRPPFSNVRCRCVFFC